MSAEGVRSDELFCAEAAEAIGSRAFVALREYDAPGSVVGLALGELARTTRWYTVPAESMAMLAAGVDAAAARAEVEAATTDAEDYFCEMAGGTTRTPLLAAPLPFGVPVPVPALLAEEPLAHRVAPGPCEHLARGLGAGLWQAVPALHGHNAMKPSTVFKLLLLVATSSCLWRAVKAQANCNLRCWISKLEILVPEMPETSGATVTNLHINQLNLGGLVSEKPTGTSFRFKATGIAATIDLHADYHLLAHFKGDVHGSIAQSSVDATIALGTSSDGLLDHLTLEDCSIDINIALLKVTDTGSKFAEWIITKVLNVLRGVLEKKLGNTLCNSVLRPLVEQRMSSELANFSGALRPYLQAVPRAPLSAVPPGMRSMHHNAVVDVVDWILDRLVGTRGVNWVVGRLSNGTGILRLSDVNAIAGLFAGSGFNATDKLSGVVSLANLSTSIAAGVTDLTLQLATWEELQILLPEDVDNYTLHSRTGMAHLAIDASFFVNVSTGTSTSIVVSTLEPAWLYESGGIHIESNSNMLEAYMRALVNAEGARRLDHGQLMDRDCLLSVVHGASLDYLFLNSSLEVARLLPLSGDIEAELDHLVSDLADTLIGLYKPVVPAFLNGVLVHKALGFVNPLVTSLLANNSTCAIANGGRDFGLTRPSSSLSFIACSLAGSTLIAVYVVLLAVLTWRAGKKPTEYSGSADKKRMATLMERFVLFMEGGEGGRPCLMCDPRVNVVVRAMIPLVLLLDIALFVSSNTSVGAAVVLRLAWQSEGSEPHVMETPALSSFGQVDSIRGLWKAKIYPLAILIAAFSGVWPYIKLVAALACWIAPSQALNRRWRGRLLVALDALGKWSLIDFYVMTIVIVSCHFNVPFGRWDPTATASPVSAAVYVLPRWGFMAFLIATIVSLITSHVVLLMHRRVAALDDPDPSGAGLDPQTGAPTHCAVMLEFMRGRNPMLAWGGRAVVSALMLLTVALLVAGSFIISIAFEFRGAVGVAVDRLLNASATREYSLLDVGFSVPSSSPEPWAFGPVLILAVYLLTALAIPVLHMLAMLGLWCAPLTLRQQRWGMTAVGVCNAWACIDVYMVSMAAVLLEIKQFVEFRVGEKCDGINHLLHRYFSQDLQGHDVCFEVAAKLTPGTWPLIVSIIFYFVFTALVMRVCHRVIDRRAVKGDTTNGGISERSTLPTSTSTKMDSPTPYCRPDRDQTPGGSGVPSNAAAGPLDAEAILVRMQATATDEATRLFAAQALAALREQRHQIEQQRLRAEQAAAQQRLRAEQQRLRAEEEAALQRLRAERAEEEAAQQRHQIEQQRLRAERAEQGRLQAEEAAAQQSLRAERAEQAAAQERARAERNAEQLAIHRGDVLPHEVPFVFAPRYKMGPVVCMISGNTGHRHHLIPRGLDAKKPDKRQEYTGLRDLSVLLAKNACENKRSELDLPHYTLKEGPMLPLCARFHDELHNGLACFATDDGAALPAEAEARTVNVRFCRGAEYTRITGVPWFVARIMLHNLACYVSAESITESSSRSARSSSSSSAPQANPDAGMHHPRYSPYGPTDSGNDLYTGVMNEYECTYGSLKCSRDVRGDGDKLTKHRLRDHLLSYADETSWSATRRVALYVAANAPQKCSPAIVDPKFSEIEP
eukprot:m51a1_g5065 hypothetical protein (1632) ;mRNA; r:123491-131839